MKPKSTNRALNDNEIREALIDFLDGLNPKVRYFDELVIGKARSDIVTVTDRLSGYEIKGDHDSYIRLPGQIKEYSRYFEENHVVVGRSHLQNIGAHVPESWGIICATDDGSGIVVEIVRKAQADKNFSLKKQMSLLWRSELSSILYGFCHIKGAGKNKSTMVKMLLEKIDGDRLKKRICDELLERDYSDFQ